MALRRQVLDHPCVIKPHVIAKQTHVEQIIKILATGDKGVERHARKRPGMQGHAAAAHVVGPRDPRGREGLFHPTVELDALGPPALGDAGARGIRQRRPLAIVKVTALGEDGQALARLRTKRVEGFLHEIRGEDHLVIVQKHHRVMAQDGGGCQTHVANGAVPAQRYGLALDLGRKLVHAVHDARGLDVGEKRDVKVGMMVENVLDTQRDVTRGRQGAYDKQDDAW